MPNIRCIIVDDEPTAREIMQHLLEQVDEVEIVAHCKNAMEAIHILNKYQIDLTFLDINMPDINGISLVNSIPKSVKVIFTTAYREYAIDGFNLQAVDYLLKPISLGRLVQAIQKYRNENNAVSPTKDHLFVRSDRKMVKVNFNDLLFVESLSDYLKIQTSSAVIITRETISNLEAKLPTSIFLRIHRSFIISLSFITCYTAEYVEVNNKAIPISRSYRDSFFRKMEGG